MLANLFGVINVPSSIWIDEAGQIVRPAEAAPAPPAAPNPIENEAAEMPPLPPRMMEIMTEAMKIQSDPVSYHAALKDWVANGADSRFALSAEEVVSRSRPRDLNVATGHAHFEIATQLELNGQHDAAIEHFRQAHELVPDSWTFRRQAWSLEMEGDGPLARFWQGPSADDPDAWPYAGDWLKDVRESGAENYSEPWTP